MAVARYLAGHAGGLGGDGRLAVAGDSAGGNLAAVAAQALTRDGTPLAGQFLFFDMGAASPAAAAAAAERCAPFGDLLARAGA